MRMYRSCLIVVLRIKLVYYIIIPFMRNIMNFHFDEKRVRHISIVDLMLRETYECAQV